ncbi:carbohydrate kinase family protein [Pedobacter deserti]|uniref:carbohydrate kinase family protein n=1 Tax=Pedobacter deserti TaxID=2817382 RepID=UPI002109F204|nr:carbohydrate kinase [Pedobacter sp. SYSU D00382]
MKEQEKQKDRHTAICFGEVLWDVLPDGPQPGGAPLNVAYHLTRLGMPAKVVSKIGQDDNGLKLEALMNNWEICTGLLQRDEKHPTSQVLARMNNGNEVTYEIVFPVAWDFISGTRQLTDAMAETGYFVYGSLASRHDATRQTLLELLEVHQSVHVFDVNLRPPFVSRSLLQSLLLKADIVKFNEAELDIMQTMFGGSYSGEYSKVAFISEAFNVPEVIVTKGEFGASYYKEGHAFHMASQEVKVADTIGSGDSFLAAFLSGHSKKTQPSQLLRNAVAMGSFIATRKGGCPDYTLSEYQSFSESLTTI